MGPASGGLQVLTLLRKARNGVGYSGTPWSGQAVNWNCRTSRFSLEPFCRTQHQGQGQQHQTVLCVCTLCHSPSPGRTGRTAAAAAAAASSPCEGRTSGRRTWPARWCPARSPGSSRRCLSLGLASTGHTLSARQEGWLSAETKPSLLGMLIPKLPCHR